MTEIQNRQLLHLVFGGELASVVGVNMHRLPDPPDGPVPTAATSGNPRA